MIDNPISQSMFKSRLGLINNEGEVDVRATLDFIKISLAQFAEAFGFTKEQVRFERMSPIVRERVKDLAAAIEFVAETFDGDEQKTKYWFNTPNPNFGGTAPKNLIVRGRYRKVRDFILAARNNSHAAR